MPIKQGNGESSCGPGTDMTPSQRAAVELAVSGEPYIFITGAAGSGKSFVTRRIIEIMRSMGKNVLACAPTGLAALNLECGMTIHAAFGFASDTCIVGNAPGEMKLKTKTPKMVKMADVLLIDEVSMLRPDLLDSVVLSLRKAQKETGIPKTLILVGDFHQLAWTLPSDDKQRILMESFYGARHEDWYAFMGRYWDECSFKTVFLTESLRQEDPEFISWLNRLKKGDPSCLDFFNASAKAPFLDGAASLFAYKNKVSQYNNRMLDSLEGELHVSKTVVRYEQETGDERILRQIEAGIPKEILFKRGAPVLFTATDYNGACSSIMQGPDQRTCGKGPRPVLVNGMSGIIMDIYKNAVIIKTEGGGLLRVEPMDRPYYVQTAGPRGFERTKIATYTNYPFMLSYAITIHKSQGMTLTKANVDPETFAPGQLYTAISRVKSREGLHLIKKITPSDLKADPEVLAFYERAEKKAGISKRKGRPTSNVDGSRRSMSLHVPKSLEGHVRDEIKQNRIIALPEKVVFVPGRINMRVTEKLYGEIKDQIEVWKKTHHQ